MKRETFTLHTFIFHYSSSCILCFMQIFRKYSSISMRKSFMWNNFWELYLDKIWKKIFFIKTWYFPFRFCQQTLMSQFWFISVYRISCFFTFLVDGKEKSFLNPLFDDLRVTFIILLSPQSAIHERKMYFSSSFS